MCCRIDWQIAIYRFLPVDKESYLKRREPSCTVMLQRYEFLKTRTKTGQSKCLAQWLSKDVPRVPKVVPPNFEHYIILFKINFKYIYVAGVTN